ncbi:MAG: hypothetical protein ACM3VZ_16595 [Acidobacteriota bacterium]
MKWVLQAKAWLTVATGFAMLTLSACGGGGSSNGAAASPSGNGGAVVPATPAAVPVQSQVLAAGTGYSLAVTSTGQIKTWGSGMHGTIATSLPIAAVGTAHWGTELHASWAISSTGDLLYWGDDAAGKLTAQSVVLSGVGQVAAVRACGSGQGALLYVLKSDGTVWAVPAWGITPASKGFAVANVGVAKALGEGTDASCSGMLAIGQDGSVWQLQASNPVDAAGVPTQAHGVAVAGLSQISQAACSVSSCLAVDGVGQVMAWGNNDAGQLGDGTRSASTAPLIVNVPKARKVMMTAAGAAYAITDSGALYGWGLLDGRVKSTSIGGLGTAPTLILGDAFGVQSLAVSPSATAHTLVLFGEGLIAGWGQNASGEVSALTGASLIDLTPTGVSLQ